MIAPAIAVRLLKKTALQYNSNFLKCKKKTGKPAEKMGQLLNINQLMLEQMLLEDRRGKLIQEL